MAAEQEVPTRIIQVLMAAAVVADVVLMDLLEAQEAKALQEEPQSLVMLAQAAVVWEASVLLTAVRWVAQEVQVLLIQSQEPPRATQQAEVEVVHRVQLLYWVDPRMEL